MAQRGCRVALLAFVSGGIYAGPWADDFLLHYQKIVNSLLAEPVRADDVSGSTQPPPPLGMWFDRVVLTVLGPPTNKNVSYSVISRQGE
eukprot:7381155-Prymnesium_polylepis.3